MRTPGSTECKKRSAALLAALLASMAGVSGASAQPHPTLSKYADEYWQAYLEHHPTEATALGDYRFNDRLNDLSAQSRGLWQAKLSRILLALRRMRFDRFTPEEDLNRRLLQRTIEDHLLEQNCDRHLMPLDPLNGPHLQFPLILVSQPFRNAEDYRAYINRLRAFPGQVSHMITNLRLGISAGWVSPRIVVDKVIPQITTHLVSDVTQSEFYKKPVAAMGVLSDADRESIRNELVDAITADVIPAYWGLLAFVQDDYLPHATATVGISALRNGDKIYAALARLHTTLPTPPERIHEIGLSEVARIRVEMTQVKEHVGFEGTLDDFLNHLRTDPRYRAQSGPELVRRYGEILERIKPKMNQLFGKLPQADCVMKEIEAFRAPASPMAYYNPAPVDGSRPAYFYINTYAPRERTLFSLEALTYHESVPGHHLQIALAQEMEELPEFRRHARFSAFVEGWALYAERLGENIGGYQDPYQRFGQLNFEMWRACRLVVDTGMHVKGWPRRQAIDFMRQNTAFTELDITAEIDRYIAWPGQALAYKMGELEIRKSRSEAEATLGEKFDLKAFHDAVLQGGAMPLDMLSQRLAEWTKEQAGG